MGFYCLEINRWNFASSVVPAYSIADTGELLYSRRSSVSNVDASNLITRKYCACIKSRKTHWRVDLKC